MAKFNTPRSILITGASSGIGAALAREYAGKNVFLAISGRDRERLETVAGECRARGAEVSAQIVDVTGRGPMRRWIEETDAVAPLDLVVANAGISGGPGGGGGGGEDEEQVRDIFAVNMAGVLNTVIPAADMMRKRGRGQIAIMSSLSAYRGLPTAPSYSASKAAVKAYGEAMRTRLAAHGIKMSVICPGFVESRMTARNKFKMPFLMTAAKAARVIRRGLAKNRARIAFPWPMAAAMWLLSILPPWLGDRLLGILPEKE
ncbi:MAG: SDR family NAD(P)-dependent oxidoreductase [Rhodospirillales bacterium]